MLGETGRPSCVVSICVNNTTCTYCLQVCLLKPYLQNVLCFAYLWPTAINVYRNYGIRASTHFCIKLFLTNRTQEVLVEGCKSGQVHVSSRVPQGTVLGPLLFLLFTDDMPTHISPGTSLKRFADDAMLYRKINNHTDQDNLQHVIDRLID